MEHGGSVASRQPLLRRTATTSLLVAIQTNVDVRLDASASGLGAHRHPIDAVKRYDVVERR